MNNLAAHLFPAITSVCHIDFSTNNKELELIDITNAKAVEDYVKQLLASGNSNLAYGGYLEKRNIYKRSKYFNNQVDSNDERNIHLGVDFWIKADTKVTAPLDGIVHSFNNNTNHGDYGPTIVLKHRVNNIIFHSLYGHLSLASLKKIKVGQIINKGEKIGWIGTSDVNGDYAPHLHFQLIKDIGDYKGDYPGVCSINNLEYYKQNCPDPFTEFVDFN